LLDLDLKVWKILSEDRLLYMDDISARVTKGPNTLEFLFFENMLYSS